MAFFEKSIGIRTSVALLTFALSGCSDDPNSALVKSKPELFDPMSVALSDPELIEGREIWMNTCTACHLRGLTGAPKIGDIEAWRPRIAQGLDTLFNHAINGYIGPDFSEMPPRGGFPDLSDEQVKLAVRFVVKASQ